MRIPHPSGKKAVIAAVGVAAALGAGGTAYAATGSASPGTPAAVTAAGPAPASPHARPAAHRARGLLRRADHASVELRVKRQWVTFDLDRGKVTSISSSSITVQRPDGTSVTEAIGPITRYAGVSTWSSVRAGRPASVISEAGTARRIRQRPAS